MRTKYTEQDLRIAVENSLSISEVCRKVGIRPVGGNYKTIKNKLKEFNIDYSHFTGQGWNVGDRYKQIKITIPTIDLLVENSIYGSYKLKNRLLKDGLKKHICECCKSIEWMGVSIPLELHHIDGDNTNNKFENLTLLCPNCHSFTDNYRGKSTQVSKKSELKKERYDNYKNTIKETKLIIIKEPKVIIIKEKRVCENCTNQIPTKSKRFCSVECYDKYKRRNVPEISELLLKIEELGSFEKIGRYYNVSGKSVSKWCKSYGILPFK